MRGPKRSHDGPMWDLAEDPLSIALLESFYNSGKPIALVCHSPGVLRHVTYKGEPLVKGKHVTGFTNGEEEEMKLTKLCPFLWRMNCCAWVPFLKSPELAAILNRRWPSDYRAKSSIVDLYRSEAAKRARCGEQGGGLTIRLLR
jgi:putative intracellular protease/amidase